jgi:excisionase family DNA binding protein
MTVITDIEPRYLTLQAASRYSGLAVPTLRALVARQTLTAYRPLKRRVLLDALELDRFLAESKGGSRVG